jgi:cell division FtsZ-interacting protein ZapD
LRDKIEHKIQLVKEFKNQKNKYQIWYENQIKSNQMTRTILKEKNQSKKDRKQNK